MTRIVLATFNIRNARGFDGRNMWPLRRRNMLAVIRSLEADILCFQEVRPAQLRWLRRRLRDYRIDGVGRDDGRGKGEHMVTAVRAAVVTVAGIEARWFTDDFALPSRHPEAGFNRFALATAVTVRGTPLTVVNTHLDERSAAARADSVVRLASWYPARSVIAGDFNCTIDDPVLAPLLATHRDALHRLPAQGPGIATHHGFTGTTDGTRIDHILASAEARVIDARIVHERPRGALPSDHWPVVADLDV